MPAEAEAMRERIKSSLRKSHPKWSDEEVDSQSYAVVQSYWKKKHGHPAFS